jgi:hypothetical protein
MAAALAASLPAPTQQRVATPQPAAPTKVPQRMEGVVDVEAAREVETVQLNSLVCAELHRSTCTPLLRLLRTRHSDASKCGCLQASKCPSLPVS